MLNKIQIIGRVGDNPEMRFTEGGKPVTNFTLASNQKYNSQDNVEWFKVVVWNRLAEIVNQYVSKGKLIYVEGRLHNRTWEKDGQKHYKTEVMAQQVIFLERGHSDGGQAQPEEYAENDCPF